MVARVKDIDSALFRENTVEGFAELRRENSHLRERPWPDPFDHTTHVLRLGDARHLEGVADESVHLIVTSPPYWTLKEYNSHEGQLGLIESYEEFLSELDRAWAECKRVLVPGGRICCVVGDVCLARKRAKRHQVMPLHADIQVRGRKIGLDCLTPVIWHKIANGANEVTRAGSGFYRKPYQPGAIVKNDIEYVLFLRKGGKYRSATRIQKTLSMLTKDEMQAWWTPIWTDLKGASTRSGHPAPFPVPLAERLIRMFSFVGDLVLDPFVGTGTTSIAAINAGRNSVGVEVDPEYFEMAAKRIKSASRDIRMFGPTHAALVLQR